METLLLHLNRGKNIHKISNARFNIEVYLVRRMMWTPESVSTASLISPTGRAKAASSNGFCIWPRPNGPKSPPCLADEQSEY